LFGSLDWVVYTFAGGRGSITGQFKDGKPVR
jgi:hypothetical protein